MTVTNDRCADILRAHDGFLLLTHKNPDGDTLGSAAALCSALKRLGKTAWLYPNPGVTGKYLPYAEKYFAPAGYEPRFILAVDIAAERLFPEGFSGLTDLCIDHHPSNTHYAANVLVQAEKSACGEIILPLIRLLCGDITPEEADLLYMAVSTDTGCFQYSNTNADTFRAAAELTEAGANVEELNTRLFRKISPARMKLEGMIYSAMSFHRDGKVVVATVTREMMRLCGAAEEDCDDLAALPGKSEDAVVSITIREQEDGACRVSVRTTREVSATAICAVFGGGGHAMASGCTIPVSPERAKRLLLDVVDEVWK